MIKPYELYEKDVREQLLSLSSKGMVSQIVEDSLVGKKILYKLFPLFKDHLIEKIKDILGEDEKDFWETTPITVRKTLEDDVPQEILFCSYDTIIIDSYGISFKPEHGVAKKLRKFDKHFVL